MIERRNAIESAVLHRAARRARVHSRLQVPGRSLLISCSLSKKPELQARGRLLLEEAKRENRMLTWHLIFTCQRMRSIYANSALHSASIYTGCELPTVSARLVKSYSQGGCSRYRQVSVPGRRRKRNGIRSRASRHRLVLPQAQNTLLNLTRIDGGGLTSTFSVSKVLLRPVPLGDAMYEQP